MNKKLIGVLIIMVKFALIFCLLITFYYGATIIERYYAEHKDFKFKETYEFNSYDKTIPPEVQTKIDRFSLFQRATLITVFFLFLLEALKYMREPETHWITELKDSFEKKISK